MSPAGVSRAVIATMAKSSSTIFSHDSNEHALCSMKPCLATTG
jgi:hypothetical protein